MELFSYKPYNTKLLECCHYLPRLLLYSVKITSYFLIVYNDSADTNCTDGSVRLVGGINELEGSVEICYNNFWGAVCHDRWTDNDVEIVCTQLGHRTIGIEWQISSLICILYITIYRSHCFYWQLLWA